MKYSLSRCFDVRQMAVYSVVFLSSIFMVMDVSAAPQGGVLPRPATDFRPTMPSRDSQAPAPDVGFIGCAAGQYVGPRPGASVYTRDTFVWAVSSRFAAAYCMPKKFIVQDMPPPLEAIAYRLVENLDEQRCDQGKPPSECSGAYEHSFDIYYQHGAFRKARSGRIFQSIGLPSKLLIAERSEVSRARGARAAKEPTPGFVPIFEYGQFLLATTAVERSSLPLGALRVRTYYESILDELDYVSLSVGAGFARSSLWGKSERTLSILVSPPQEIQPGGGGAQANLVVRLPARLEKEVIEADLGQRPFNSR